ncbi:MAG: hypothetical protein KTR31_10660 [Myxococcales bacterium]|nr:hypothetical protein [Myxococcales bacterium]
MLDAYIIDRIRRDRENAQRRNAQLPLHIEDPNRTPVPPTRRRNDKEDPERGSVVIDFKL